MCGIVGFIGHKNAKDVVLNGLTRLEYRGYDSAGLSLYNQRYQIFDVYKDEGRVAKLVESTKHADFSTIGIGHTRWATHGKVNKENSHPHYSQTRRFIVVHNGVIENYQELKDQYLHNHVFQSETDTEVIAQLIETFSQTLHVENAITTTLKLLHGSYALLVLDSNDPEKIYAAKYKSPLILGVGSDGITIASDLMALVGYSSDYHALDDKTFIVARKDDVRLFNLDHQPLDLHLKKIELDDAVTTKGEYAHYMLKEIHEQPSVIRRILTNYYDKDIVQIKPEILSAIKDADRLYILAAGTSMHAGLIGKQLFEKLCEIPVEVHIASEFAYQKPLLSKKPLFILVTQSGETADLRACLVDLNERGFETLTITNVPTSTLAREATYSIELFAGPEIAVASTKAYVAQVSVLTILAYELSQKPFDLHTELSKAAISIENFLASENIREIVRHYLTRRNAFFIGRGLDYFIGLEAALKLKEISYIQTEGFAAGELKHGTIALIEDSTPVIALISDPKMSPNTRSNLKEVQARGAKTFKIVLESCKIEGDEVIIDDVYSLLTPLVMVVPTQLIAYYAALERAYDIDKPRNLAKSVTVE
ncbi:MAG: glutamine--fructose-6-phosphate aminotransferase [Tenericutes bacterium GWC2_34_14]|nr:MAG: glutamine--fructose-6-phosphate aminotransferase [Tenericutes bacterium GWC2_34_14]OHE34506.1 MAG: glutamine--fructose-6-phosphate aminotransferase [Tenericutes bacterium GWE2_34_108]OHE35863.1 MAG: glutamine--fructose-6-phosphate aminotransferase [Tenericutes bacterium GWF1_35_14]OHE39051.1 MAG: glutamine--fructose-6-phosphate aminotransferase [Tenericutes bacterium GWF2_35_184]OHE42882.1 MAG: glutamine--fructose-6-phosphate aminotransferase [Tenericutes bacterium RIFOXYA2_FULL_36_32]